jgi:hypothetical protein
MLVKHAVPAILSCFTLFPVHNPYILFAYTAILFDRCKLTYMMATGKISGLLRHFTMQTWE